MCWFPCNTISIVAINKGRQRQCQKCCHRNQSDEAIISKAIHVLKNKCVRCKMEHNLCIEGSQRTSVTKNNETDVATTEFNKFQKSTKLKCAPISLHLLLDWNDFFIKISTKLSKRLTYVTQSIWYSITIMIPTSRRSSISTSSHRLPITLRVSIKSFVDAS